MNGWSAQNVDYLVFLALVGVSWSGLWLWSRDRPCHRGMPWSILCLVAAVLFGRWSIVDRTGHEARTGDRRKIELLPLVYAFSFRLSAP